MPSLANSSNVFLSDALPAAVSTSADDESSVTGQTADGPSATSRWQEIIDHILIEWALNPAQLADDGIEPPTRETVAMAIQEAQIFKQRELAPPTRVVPDAEGGIVFEREERDVLEMIRISPDRKFEYGLFRNGSLIQRLVRDLAKRE